MSKDKENKAKDDKDNIGSRCGWLTNDDLYIKYHDNEWGIPSKDEKHLFEMLNLEGQQAGLSWITILKKRKNYNEHFFRHPISEIAKMSDSHLTEKLQDAGIIRHFGKLTAIRDNAKAWSKATAEGENMPEYLWSFVGGVPQVNSLKSFKDGRTSSAESIAMSKALKKRGFRFVGPTTMYAFMQAVGMINDHEDACPCKFNGQSKPK